MCVQISLDDSDEEQDDEAEYDDDDDDADLNDTGFSAEFLRATGLAPAITTPRTAGNGLPQADDHDLLLGGEFPLFSAGFSTSANSSGTKRKFFQLTRQSDPEWGESEEEIDTTVERTVNHTPRPYNKRPNTHQSAAKLPAYSGDLGSVDVGPRTLRRRGRRPPGSYSELKASSLLLTKWGRILVTLYYMINVVRLR